MNQSMTKTFIALILVFVMVFSFFVLGKTMSSPDVMSKVVRSIDEKTETVLKLTAATTVASAVISAIPDDTATPIAEKLADFTEYFLLILCVLYMEKYLLTLIGTAVFRILIPVACLILLWALFSKNKKTGKLAIKLGVVGLALYILIPCSILASDLVYNTYRSSIDTAVTSAQTLTDEAGAIRDGEGESGGDGIFSSITDAVDKLLNKAANTLKQFVETLAIMIATSCLIPMLTLVFFLWLIRQLTGLNIPIRPGAGRAGLRQGAEQGKKES